VVAEVVCRLNAAVVGEVPEMVDVMEVQVGAETAPAGPDVTVQVKMTDPVKPPAGVKVTVELALAPGPDIVDGVAEMVSDGITAADTVTCTLVDAVIFPVAESTPSTVSMKLPAVVAVALWTVSVAVPLEFPTVVVAGSQVSPEVEGAQERATGPVNPPDGVIEMVDVPLAPGLAIVVEVAASANDWATAGLTVRGTDVETTILLVAASTPVTSSE
jgi:hypothetical protein